MTAYADAGVTLAAPVVHRGEYEKEIAEPLTMPMLSHLEPRQLRAAGCGAVRFSHPVEFGADAEFDVRFTRFLREALSLLVSVEWSLATPGPADISAVCHLPPPSATAAASGSEAAVHADRWRSEYGFGHCYYRLGPAFVHVVDVRDAEEAARFLLDDPAAVEAFLLLGDAVRLAEVPPLAAELAAQLAEARLLLRIGGWATILPSRLERWPLPCTAV